MNTKTNPVIILIIVTISSFTATFTVSSINIALPAIGEELSMNAVMLGWIATSFLLSSSISMIPFGKLGDIFGRNKIFTSGIILYIMSSLLTIFSFTSSILILSRVFQGISGGMIIGTSIGILLSVYPPEKKGIAIGIYTSSVYIGLSAGPLLGGLITSYYNWRGIFILNICLSLIIFALVLIYFKKEFHEAKKEKFDVTGLIIFALFLFCLIYGFSELPTIVGIIFAALGLLFFAAFILWETKTPFPMLDVTMFIKNKIFGLSNLAASINYSATYSVTFFLSLYLQYVKGYSAHIAGLIIITQPVVQAAFSPITGKLSDKIQPRYLSSSGMGLIAIALFVISFFNSQTDNYLIIIALMLLGIGFALFSSPNMNSIMSSVDKKLYGVASATIGTMRQIGQMLSMGIAIILFALIIGKVKISNEQSILFLKAMKTGFIIFSILCVIGIFASMARGNDKSLIKN